MSSTENISDIVIRGFPPDISAEVLSEYLESLVTGIVKDKQEKPKIEINLTLLSEQATAIVSFVSIEMANEAVTKLNGHLYDQNDEYTLTSEVQKAIDKKDTDVQVIANEMSVSPLVPVTRHQSSRKVRYRLSSNLRKSVILSSANVKKVYMEGFPNGTSKKDIKKTYNAAGTIIKISFFKGDRDAEFGKCLLFFKNPNAAEKFIKKFNDTSFPGSENVMKVKFLDVKVVFSKKLQVTLKTEEDTDNASLATAVEPDEREIEEPEQPPAPEPTFTCIVCTEVWPEKDIISCVAVDDTQSNERHYICIQCSCKHARSLTVDGPVGTGGAGLPCSASGCSRVILWGPPLQKFLDENTNRLLDKRLRSAALMACKDIEFCIKCDYGICIEAKTTVIQYFDCQKCGALFCRLCKIDYDTHVGKSCAEAAPSNTLRLNYEEELSAAVIRICPYCHTQFLKLDGCNLMTCGTTNCNTTMCYLCRQTGIDDSHFGSFDTGGCIQGASSSVFDENRLAQIKQRAHNDGEDDLGGH